MKLDYVRIKGHFDGSKYSDNKSRKYSNMLCKIEEFINLKDIILFYPKNLFVEESDLEVYVVLEDKILRGRILEGINIEIKILRLKSLADFKYECTCDSEGFHRLTIEFKNGETIVLDSMKDTNSSWSYDFGNQIKALVKHLMQFTYEKVSCLWFYRGRYSHRIYPYV